MTAAEWPPAVLRTRRWIERFVIGLGLCPFAAEPYRAGRVVYSICEETSLEAVYAAFLKTLEEFVLADPQQCETALLILTRGLPDFDDYLDALAVLEQAVVDAGLEGVVQIASFHPDYRFADVPRDDPANFSNRSPLPMFHLLREEGLAAALESCPEPESIPDRNVRRLRQLGLQRIRAVLDSD